jgi:Flp pilus assembly protein TadB
MRAWTVAIALGLLAMSQAAHSKEERKSARQAPATSKVYTAEETDALVKAVRERDEARQRAWDQKTKNITRGICSGC